MVLEGHQGLVLDCHAVPVIEFRPSQMIALLNFHSTYYPLPMLLYLVPKYLVMVSVSVRLHSDTVLGIINMQSYSLYLHRPSTTESHLCNHSEGLFFFGLFLGHTVVLTRVNRWCSGLTPGATLKD